MYNVVAVVFLVVGVGAGIVSLATSHWTEVSSTRHYGLLQTCKEFEFKVFSPVLCYNNLERTDWDLIKSKRTIDNGKLFWCLWLFIWTENGHYFVNKSIISTVMLSEYRPEFN